MIFSSRRYAAVLYKVLAGYSTDRPDVAEAFARFLVARGESGRLNDIRRAFVDLRLEKEKKIHSQIVSARPDRVEILPERLSGKQVEEEFTADPKFIGGVKVRIGDRLIDNTISRRLRNLRNALS